MINKEELRIGNTVFAYEVNVRDMIVFTIRTGADIDQYEAFNPIPMDEEWALKLGFTKTEANKCYMMPLVILTASKSEYRCLQSQ